MSVKEGPVNPEEHRKSKEPRFDISFHEHGPTLDFHFCREWDDEGGCYGTNPEHGMSFDQAREEMRQWHLREAERWATVTYDKWFGADSFESPTPE